MSDALRVGLVGPASPWRGGIAQHTDATADALASRGHDVRVVSFSRQYPGLLFPGTSQREEGRDPAPHTTLTLDSLNPFSWRAEGRRLRAFRPDVVVAGYWLPFFVPAYAGVCRGLDRETTRVVLDCHNVIPHERRLLNGLLTRWMLRVPDAFIVHSGAVRDTLLSLRPDADVRVSPLPLSHDFADGPGRVAARESIGLAPGARVLLFFGFIRQYKGLDVAIDAMSELPEDVTLLVVGESYEDVAPYRARAAPLGDRVRFHDRYVPSSEVGRYFDAADLVVLPYRRATQSGVVPLAMRFGRPVVSTSVGGLVDHVTDGVNGLLVPPDDPSALARAISGALAADRHEALTRGVEDCRRALTWDRFASVVEELAVGSR